MGIQVGPNAITIHADDEVLVCDIDGQMSRNKEQGYLARDTRFVSGYRLKIGRAAPVLLNSAALDPCAARFEFTNPPLMTPSGSLPSESIELRLDRVIGQGIHEDYEITNHARDAISLDLEVSIESDFSDLFDIKSHTLIRRGLLETTWDRRREVLVTRYQNGEFKRRVEFRVQESGSTSEYANGGLLWRLVLAPGQSWHTCLAWSVDTGSGILRSPTRSCIAPRGRNSRQRLVREQWVATTARFIAGDPEVSAIASQAVQDLASLRIHLDDKISMSWPGRGSSSTDTADPGWVPAAGVPWFMTLFGRDALVVSLQTLSLSPRFALGALRSLASLQADSYDNERDMQPGKIEHEVRHGELAELHLIPQTPYYGTHDATSLYVSAAAQAWWWHGDRKELDSVRPHVERALSWIDVDGDSDGDGLQEYQTRAKSGGFYNQGWKDSGEAIVHADATIPALPIALCELQGYVVAAKRSWARILDEVYHESAAAARLRSEADRLAELIEERFWWEEEGTYYLGLDGHKKPIASVTSNPAHLLWSGAIVPERAALVAKRLLSSDMWSGWGIRTLSSHHPAYNPFAYQLGSVWPHDNAIAVAGLRRYGLDLAAAQVSRGIVDAASRFASRRLPEVFAGLSRDGDGFPVQYLGANIPQAWAAGAVIHLITSLLGLEADAPNHSLTVDPALPEWLGSLGISQLGVGTDTVDLLVERQADGRHTLEVTASSGDLEVRLVSGSWAGHRGRAAQSSLEGHPRGQGDGSAPTLPA